MGGVDNTSEQQGVFACANLVGVGVGSPPLVLRMGGRAYPRPEDWALVDRCVGQFDNGASYVDIRFPTAEVEPSKAMYPWTMEAEPMTYAPSRQD